MRTHLSAVFLILAAGSLVYSNSLGVPFLFDDQRQIVENPIIRNLEALLSWGSSDAFNPRRVLGYITFALNYQVNGLDVTGFHLVNLAVHLANALLVYALVQLTFRTPHLADCSLAARGTAVALVAALIFVVHPLQTQAVTYIVQRFTSLATLFYLASLALYAQGRLRLEAPGEGIAGRAARGCRAGWPHIVPALLIAGSAVSALAAMKTKEIAYTLPFAVTLYDVSFFRSGWRKRILCLLPLALTLPVIPLSLLTAGESAGNLLGDVSEASRVQTEIPRLDYLFTQFRVIVTYLRLLFLPVSQNLDYDYPVYADFFTPPVFLSFGLLVLLIGVALSFCFRRRFTSHGLRLAGFGILWFFLALTVECSLIPIADVINEHRVYLPSVGAMVSFAVALVLTGQRLFRTGSKVPLIAAALLVVVLAVVSHRRNQVWGDGVTLWEDVVRKSPAKSRPHVNLGLALKEQGRLDDAIGHYREALRIDPGLAEARTNLGLAYLAKNRGEEAILEFRRAIALNPDLPVPRLNLGAALADRGELDAAIQQYLAASRIEDGDPMLHNNLGVAYFRKGMIDQAIAHLQRAVVLRPEYPDAHYNLGIAYGSKGWSERAQEEMVLGLQLQNMKNTRQ